MQKKLISLIGLIFLLVQPSNLIAQIVIIPPSGAAGTVTVSSNLTSGQVPYATGTTTLTSSAAITYDSGSDELMMTGEFYAGGGVVSGDEESSVGAIYLAFNPPRVLAVSGVTDTDLGLSAKGAGTINLLSNVVASGSFTVDSITAPDGFISGGGAVVNNAVIFGSVTGGAVQIGAAANTGDADISLELSIRGAGHIIADGPIISVGSATATDFILSGTTQTLSGSEVTPPSAPAANNFKLFSQDNGAGKTQLCVIFNSGAVQCFATQP